MNAGGRESLGSNHVSFAFVAHISTIKRLAGDPSVVPWKTIPIESLLGRATRENGGWLLCLKASKPAFSKPWSMSFSTKGEVRLKELYLVEHK